MRRLVFGRRGLASLISTRLSGGWQELEPALSQRRGGALMVWLRRSGCRYIVAADSAGGGEGDFAAVQVIDQDTGLQCAELQERLRPIGAGEGCGGVAKEYHGALIAVERNNHGARCWRIIETSERYTRMCIGRRVRWGG
jgi:hypothetical protein